MSKQETLKEVAKEYAENEIKDRGTDDDKLICSIDFIAGAKWQQERMYSDEDMQEYAEFCIICNQNTLPCITAKDWFEQFKKK